MAAHDANTYGMFAGLKEPDDLTKYNLFRGVTDFTQLKQFEMYEHGYPYLILVSIPRFLEDMAQQDNDTRKLVDNYKAIIEREFIGLDQGIDNIQSSPVELSNGTQTINVISKVEAPSATTISMTYKEHAGEPITRLHELYLRSIRDPATQFKTYNGMIKLDGSPYDPRVKGNKIGYANECFSFLYMHTDNTGLLLERAVYFTCAQPTTAQLEIYNGKKGEVDFSEINVEFNTFPLMSKAINLKAQSILDHMNTKGSANYVERNSWNYDYYGINDAADGLNQSKLVGK